jgi:hypothetical protein
LKPGLDVSTQIQHSQQFWARPTAKEPEEQALQRMPQAQACVRHYKRTAL